MDRRAAPAGSVASLAFARQFPCWLTGCHGDFCRGLLRLLADRSPSPGDRRWLGAGGFGMEILCTGDFRIERRRRPSMGLGASPADPLGRDSPTPGLFFWSSPPPLRARRPRGRDPRFVPAVGYAARRNPGSTPLLSGSFGGRVGSLRHLPPSATLDILEVMTAQPTLHR